MLRCTGLGISFQEFFREGEVGGGAGGDGRVAEDAHAVAGGFAEADIPGNNGFVDAFGKMAAHFIDNIFGEIGSHIVHGEEDAVEAQVGVGGVLKGQHHVGDDAEAFEGVILALKRNEKAVGGGEGVEGDQSEGRGAVQKNIIVVILFAYGLEGFFETIQIVIHTGDFDFSTGQVQLGGGNPQFFLIGGLDDVFERGFTDQHLVNTGGRAFVQTQPGGGIGLGVEIDEEHFFSQSGDCRREIDRRGGFSHPAFLVGNGRDKAFFHDA